MWRQPNKTELNVLYVYGKQHNKHLSKAVLKHKILIRPVRVYEKHNNKAKIALMENRQMPIDLDEFIKIIPEETDRITLTDIAYLIYIKPWYTPTIDNKSWLKRSYIVSKNFTETLIKS